MGFGVSIGDVHGRDVVAGLEVEGGGVDPLVTRNGNELGLATRGLQEHFVGYTLGVRVLTVGVEPDFSNDWGGVGIGVPVYRKMDYYG